MELISHYFKKLNELFSFNDLGISNIVELLVYIGSMMVYLGPIILLVLIGLLRLLYKHRLKDVEGLKVADSSFYVRLVFLSLYGTLTVVLIISSIFLLGGIEENLHNLKGISFAVIAMFVSIFISVVNTADQQLKSEVDEQRKKEETRNYMVQFLRGKLIHHNDIERLEKVKKELYDLSNSLGQSNYEKSDGKDHAENLAKRLKDILSRYD